MQSSIGRFCISVALALLALVGTSDSPARALDVGYYDMSLGGGNASQVAPIVAAGHTAVPMLTLSAAELEGIDVLFVQNPSNGAYGAEYLAQLTAIESAVASGMILIIHDRWVDQAETILPGESNFDIQRSFSDANSIDIRDGTTRVTDGAGGSLSDTSLDGGNFSSHGFADASSLPLGARLILSRTRGFIPFEDWIVTFSYTFGEGAVIYSSIPLDLFLASSAMTTPTINFRDVYAPNVIDYAALLALRIPDLAATVDDDATEAVPGERITYTIVIDNFGPGDAADAPVTIDFSSFLPDMEWSCTPSGTASCTPSGTGDVDDVATLASGESVTYVATGTIDPGATGSLITMATVTNPVGDDPALTNNTDSDSNDLTPIADVMLSKTGPGRADSGQQVAYTLTTHNVGPSNATGVRIFDPTPSGLTLVSASGPCAGGFPCDVGALPAGSSASTMVTYAVPTHFGPGPIINRASAVAATRDPAGDNNRVTSSTAVDQEGSADLALRITAPGSAMVTSSVTYRVEIENLGPHDAQSVVLAHVPPTGLSLVENAETCNSDFSNGMPCDLGTINADSSVTFDVTFGIPGDFTGSLRYEATVSSGTSDPVPDNDGASAEPLLGADTVDLVLEKSGPAVAELGDDVTYTLTVTNRGPAEATGVLLEDADPAGLTFVTAAAPCTGGLSGPACDLGTLAAGESIVVTATWNIPGDYAGANPITNVAMVSALEVAAFTDDDTARAQTGIGREVTDLRIEKSAPSEVAAGRDLTHALTVINAGPGTAGNVILTDTPDTGQTPSSATAPCDTAPFFPCDLGDLTPGETVVVGVTFDIAPDHGTPDPLDNTADVVSDNVDVDPANNTSVASTDVVKRADLQVTKTDGLLQTAQGLDISYTMVVTNMGPSDVAGATVTDAFSPLLGTPTWCRAPGAGSTCVPVNSGAIADSVDLAAGDSVTYTAIAEVTAATGTVSNTVTVAAPDGTDDPDAGNNAATDDDTVIVEAPDLMVTKTGPVEAVPGTTLTYTLRVTNVGPGIALDSMLVDPTPAGLTLMTATGPCNDILPCALGNLEQNDVVDVTVTYDVPASYAGPESIVNTASVTTTSPDNNPDNDSATTATPVQRRADLDVTKVNPTESPDKLVPGEAVTYTIQIANLGPSDALGVQVTDPLPSPPMALLLFPEWTCTAAGGALCGADMGTGAIDEVVDLPDGGSLTYRLDAVVDPSAVSDIENTVMVTPPGNVIDPVPGNNVATDADGVQPVADLGIAVSNARDHLVPGEPVEYTIVVSNLGPSDAMDATVTDQPPVALAAPEWACTATGGAMCGNPSGLGDIDETVDLPVGGELTFVLTAVVDPAATGTLDYSAEVAAPPIVLIDPVADDNRATDSDPLTRVADIRIIKTGPGIATRGMPLTYTLTVGNDGPSDATVVLTDPTPPGLGTATVVETSDPPPQSARCTVGFPCVLDLALAEEATFTVTYDIPMDYSGPDPIVNRAALSGAGDPLDPVDDAADPNADNNIAASAVPVERSATADLRLTKVAPAVSAIGSTVTYRLEVTNLGPDDAPSVVLTETTPDGLAFVSATAPCELGFDCALGTLNAGASTTVEVTFEIPPDYPGPTLIVNTASVSSAAADGDLANNSDDGLTTLVADPFDLVLTKTGPLVAETDSEVTFSIVVTNRGPATATNTRLDDPTPPGLTFVTASDPCSGGFPCFLDTVESGATVTIESTFAIPDAYTGPDPIANTATVTADSSDAFIDNNSATWFTGISGQAADLVVAKTGLPTVAAGGDATYALVVRNMGPGAAVDAMLDDPTPSGTAQPVVSAPCDGGFPCSLGDLPAGSAMVIEVAFPVASGLDAGTSLTNIATVSGSTPDPDMGNDSSTAMTTVVVEADLEVSKTNDRDSVVPGMPVTYTIEVSNLGPSDAPGVRVTDFFPAELSGIAWTCAADAGSSCAAGAAGNGDIDRSVDIAAGGTVTYTATGLLASASVVPLMNRASAAPPAGVPDPNPDNNTSTDTDPVTPMADLAISKTDGRDTAIPGESVMYTIIARNLGPSDAPGVDVTDRFAPELSMVEWTCVAQAGATCGHSGTLEILDTANLPAGSMVTYTAMAAVAPDATGDLVNVASVAPSAENAPPVIDPNETNNEARDTDTLTPIADIVITKDDDRDTATPGGHTVYTIAVTNLGPSDAPAVHVSDTFQAPVTSASWTCSAENGGDCLAATGGDGDIGVTVGLPVGGNVVFMATAQIDPAATGLLINTAEAAVPAGVTDPVPVNNTETDTDELVLEADLAVTKRNGASSVIVGTEVRFTITVTNLGPSNIIGATVADIAPETLIGVEWTCDAEPSASCTASGTGDITDTVTLFAESSVTYEMTGVLSPDAGTMLENTATVTPPGDATDPDPLNNTDTDTDPVRREADLAVDLSGLPDVLAVGDELTFDTGAENLGPSPADAAVVTLTLPPELAFTSSATCIHDNGLVTCPLGLLETTESARAEVILTAEFEGTWTVTADVSSQTTDPEPNNDQASEATTVLPAEIFIFADGFESGDPSAWSATNPP